MNSKIKELNDIQTLRDEELQSFEYQINSLEIKFQQKLQYFIESLREAYRFCKTRIEEEENIAKDELKRMEYLSHKVISMNDILDDFRKKTDGLVSGTPTVIATGKRSRIGGVEVENVDQKYSSTSIGQSEESESTSPFNPSLAFYY